MTHDQITEYVLGELDADAIAAFETHLESCSRCRSELTEMAPALVSLASGLEVAPPSGLRKAVLAEISKTVQLDELGLRRRGRPSRKILQAVVAVAASAAVGIFAIANLVGRDPVGRIVDADSAIALTLASTEAYEDEASVEAFYRSDTGDVALIASSLEPIDEGRTYQAWVITPEMANPAGVFVPDPDGSVRLVLDGTYREGALIGITEEPAGGSPAPTTDVLFLTSS